MLLWFTGLFQDSCSQKKFSKIEIRLQNELLYLTLHIPEERGMKKLIQLQPTAVSRVDIAYCSSLSKTNISCLCSVNYSEKQIKKKIIYFSAKTTSACVVVSWWTDKTEGRSRGRLSPCSVAETEGVAQCQCDPCPNSQCCLKLRRGMSSKSVEVGANTDSLPLWNSKFLKRRSCRW